MKQPLVQLENITLQRHQQIILDDVNLTIGDGDFVMLVGPNGSGKSTLMKIINGMVKPNSGRFLLCGKSMQDAAVHDIAKDVATLTQDVQQSTFSELTVEMNLDLALERAPTKLSRNEKLNYLAGFSESLNERMHIAAGKLSGGQRQALALAMCFAHKPKLLLLDEHTSALDPKAAKHLMKVTNDYVTRFGITTIMISHHLEHVLSFGNRLVVVNEGRIVLDLDSAAKQKLQLQDLVAFAY